MSIEELQKRIKEAEDKIEAVLNAMDLPNEIAIDLQIVQDDEGFCVAIMAGIGSKEEEEHIPFKHRRN